MATVTFYEKPGCANNARQKALLTAAGHTVLARDLLAEPWTAERLRPFFGDLPVAAWFNPAAPRIKSGAVDPTTVDANQAMTLLLADHLLIRRPLMEADGVRVVGFDATRVDRWLGLEPHGDVQTCRQPAGHGCAHPAEVAP
jgi:nitrogenase-associated protein